MKRIALVVAVVLAAIAPNAAASTISFTAPSLVAGPFDVVVKAADLFAGRSPDDLIIAFGFNVSFSRPSVLSFLGATSGPLFDAATSEPGTSVFAAASGFGIDPSVTGPTVLATLRFAVIGTGPVSITITSDLTNPFQGLQYLNPPFAESIAGTISMTAVPEPSTLALLSGGLLGGGVLVRRLRVSGARW